MHDQWYILVLLAAAGAWAGAQNAVAGGGSFVTMPALVLVGMDPKLANIASAVAIYPGQLVSAVGNRRLITMNPAPPLYGLAFVSLLGGAAGSMLLLLTPGAVFDWLVPWLILFATGIFALGAVRKQPLASGNRLHPGLVLALEFLVAVYGGYYGGGVGFLMMALLGFSGARLRSATAIKNVLVAVLNGSAVFVFVVTTALPLGAVAAVGTGAVAGTVGGVWLLRRIHERILTIVIICLGLAFSIGLFIRSA